jgi:heptosyltransferase I
VAGLREFLEFRRRVEGRRFDLVVDLQVYLKAGLLTWMLESPVKLGFDRARARDLNGLFVTHRIPPHEPQHVQDQYFEFLEHLGVPVVREWDFAFTAEERAAQDRFFRELDRPALAVVLKTTREGKDWILERYARVLEVAEGDFGLRPVLVGSEAPAERAAAEELCRMTRAEPVNALKNDLRRLAWILDGSALYLGPDTGPLHVADALGTPTVGLYGYTDPTRVGPYREEFRELVVDAWTRDDEPAADRRTPSMEFRPGRMERITVDDVLEKLELAVDRYVRGRSRGPGGAEGEGEGE